MASPQSIDDYLARLDDDKRAALEKLRGAIRAALPAAIVRRLVKSRIAEDAARRRANEK